jgi:cation transport regulator
MSVYTFKKEVNMPYNTINELPEKISNHLPTHAQHIFLNAFNAAWDEYKKPAKRRDDSNREQVAYKVAWSAVKKEYTKGQDGQWQKKPKT